MNSETQDKLNQIFAAVAGDQVQTMEPVARASDELAASLHSAAQQQAAVPQQAAARQQASAAQATPQSSRSTASEVLSVAKTVMESGLGLIPLVTGLIGLFSGGGDSSTPPPLVKYAMPEKVHFQAADTANGIGNMDYDQFGSARPWVAAPASAAPPPLPAAPQITVNVQAMDSRSFLDHSGEIAQAVRDAMLNLSSINDVVSNL
jgi:hypothetical protein